MTAATILVTGANRGIGLEHVRAALAAGHRVIGAARAPGSATALARLAEHHPGQLRVIALDVTDEASVAAAATALGGDTVDALVNNAGTYGPGGWSATGQVSQSAAGMDYAVWRQILEVNVLGAFRVAAAFQPHLARSARPLHVLLSSDLGSITNNRVGHSHAYRSSKAAVNMLAKGLAFEWPGIITVALAPGWCRTELGGDDAPLDPADSVRDQQATFARLTLADSGRFIDRFGATVPW
jgi:NAD(P)-dependent dehydrogenase (short-subunit alcohol dehydrogenase family)